MSADHKVAVVPTPDLAATALAAQALDGAHLFGVPTKG